MTWQHGARSQTRKGERYDWQHQKKRNEAAKRHSPDHPCARCGHPLGVMSSSLHFDHTDDGSGYLGFSHGDQPCPVCGEKCNLTAGATKGSATAHSTPADQHPLNFRQSRTWLT